MSSGLHATELIVEGILSGLSGEHPMVGRDLTLAENRNREGCAIMQFDKTLAYVVGDAVAVLQQDLPPKLFKYSDKKLVEQAGSNDVLVEKAQAYSLFAQKAYAEQLYR